MKTNIAVLELFNAPFWEGLYCIDPHQENLLIYRFY